MMPKKSNAESEVKEKEDQEMNKEIKIKGRKEIKEKPGETLALKNKLKKTETEIKQRRKEYQELKEEFLRQMADKDNLRKRLERDKNEFYQYSLSEILKEFLVVLDNFERAFDNENQNDSKSFREGIEMIYKQYQDLLWKQGVAPIEIEEKIFDPNMHQAFMTEESEAVDQPEVSEELQRGYTLHQRLLRPALVKVIVPKKGK